MRVLKGATDDTLEGKNIDFTIFEILDHGMITDEQSLLAPLKKTAQFLESKGYFSYYMGPKESLIQQPPMQSCLLERRVRELRYSSSQCTSCSTELGSFEKFSCTLFSRCTDSFVVSRIVCTAIVA